MSDSCVFCKIVSKEARAELVYVDDQVTAFRDMHPVAPTHILIVPNKHIEWGWKPDYDADAFFDEYFLPAIKKRYERQG